MNFDYLVFIGRFQPFHLGHEFVMMQAFNHSNHLIVLIGSTNLPRTLKNPLDFNERRTIIQSHMMPLLKPTQQISCLPVDDAFDDKQWTKNVKDAVGKIVPKGASVGIIGHNKDESSYYLQSFPDWQFVEVMNFHHLSATKIRQAYFDHGHIDKQNLPDASIQFLQQFQKSQHYRTLAQDHQLIINFQKKWQHAPYAPVFVTADAMVLYANHVLLIERSGYGAGLWALPGGFIDQNESWLDCAVRELAEETTLIIDKKTLIGSAIFDDPKRSQRGRFISQAFLFDISQDFDAMPAITAQDDAKDAFWLDLDKLTPKLMFEDHYQIIKRLLKLNAS